MTANLRQQIERFARSPADFRAELLIPTGNGSVRFGDVMADFQRDRFASLDPALQAVSVGRRPAIGRHWWEATKGASKDSDLAVCLLWLLAFTRRPLACQVGAADADQADELRKAAKDILRLNPWLEELLTIQNYVIFNKHSEARCEIISADVAGSHGARPDVLILNELSHIQKKEFAENLRDNAAKVPHGLVVIATNAGVLDSWQWKWRELARNSSRWRFHQYAKPSPWLDPEEMKEAEIRNSASRFRRLWWGVWSDGGGDALDGATIQAAVNSKLGPMRGDEPGWLFAAGLDLGVSRDHSALVVVGKHVGHVESVTRPAPVAAVPIMARLLAEIDGREIESPEPQTDYIVHPGTGRLRLAFVQSWRPPAGGQIELSEVEAATLAVHQRFRLAGCFYDPHQAVLLAQRLRSADVPMIAVNFVGANLHTMASELLEQFNSRNIELWDHEELVADLKQLNIVEKSYGHKLEARHSEAGHADRATGLVLALFGIREFASQGPPPVLNRPLVCFP